MVRRHCMYVHLQPLNLWSGDLTCARRWRGCCRKGPWTVARCSGVSGAMQMGKRFGQSDYGVKVSVWGTDTSKFGVGVKNYLK